MEGLIMLIFKILGNNDTHLKFQRLKLKVTDRQTLVPTNKNLSSNSYAQYKAIVSFLFFRTIIYVGFYIYSFPYCWKI